MASLSRVAHPLIHAHPRRIGIQPYLRISLVGRVAGYEGIQRDDRADFSGAVDVLDRLGDLVPDPFRRVRGAPQGSSTPAGWAREVVQISWSRESSMLVKKVQRMGLYLQRRSRDPVCRYGIADGCPIRSSSFNATYRFHPEITAEHPDAPSSSPTAIKQCKPWTYC
jgi:hypothetical protein